MQGLFSKIKDEVVAHDEEIMWGLYLALLVTTFVGGYSHGKQHKEVSRWAAWNFGPLYKLGRWVGSK